MSTDWLKRKGNAKEVTFYFFEKDRNGEVREAIEPEVGEDRGECCSSGMT